jgi:hypothetical protein
MRDYGQVQCAWWGHPDTAALSNEAKLLFLYLLTGPHSNGLGCYRLPPAYIQADLGWALDKVSSALAQLESEQANICLLCRDTNYILMPNYLKWNAIANPKVAAARVREAREVPKNSQVWAGMVEALSTYARKHLPKDFVLILDQEWLPQAARVPGKTKEVLWARDGGKCKFCDSREDLTIDHIRPLSYGGTHAIQNLQILCRSCNSKRFPNGIDTVSDWAVNSSGSRSETLVRARSETLSKQEPNLTEPNYPVPRVDVLTGEVIQ